MVGFKIVFQLSPYKQNKQNKYIKIHYYKIIFIKYFCFIY